MSILLLITLYPLLFTNLPKPVAAQDLCQNREILFVGASRPLPITDEPLRLYLIALGHKVTVRSDDEVRKEDAIDKDLIIISESAESKKINTKFRDARIPLLTWEGWLQDDLAMTGSGTSTTAMPETITDIEKIDDAAERDALSNGNGPTHIEDKDEGSYGERTGQRTIIITAKNHPLSAGYSGEVQTVKSRSNRFHWGVPSEDAIRVAHDIKDEHHSMLYAYETGAMMVGYRAPARRVFLHNATAPDLTNVGLTLFLNATYWAMGCLDTEATPSPTATATTTLTVTPTQTPEVTPTPTLQQEPPNLSLEMRDILFSDRDSNGQVSDGDILLYSIELQNREEESLQELLFEDRLDANLQLIAGSVNSRIGTIESGNTEGDNLVAIKISTLAPNELFVISFQVTVAPHTPIHQVRNQAMVRFVEQSRDPSRQFSIFSDDPDTPDLQNDATITPIGDPNIGVIFLPWVTSPR